MSVELYLYPLMLTHNVRYGIWFLARPRRRQLVERCSSKKLPTRTEFVSSVSTEVRTTEVVSTEVGTSEVGTSEVSTEVGTSEVGTSDVFSDFGADAEASHGQVWTSEQVARLQEYAASVSRWHRRGDGPSSVPSSATSRYLSMALSSAQSSAPSMPRSRTQSSG